MSGSARAEHGASTRWPDLHWDTSLRSLTIVLRISRLYLRRRFISRYSIAPTLQTHSSIRSSLHRTPTPLPSTMRGLQSGWFGVVRVNNLIDLPASNSSTATSWGRNVGRSSMLSCRAPSQFSTASPVVRTHKVLRTLFKTILLLLPQRPLTPSHYLQLLDSHILP